MRRSIRRVSAVAAAGTVVTALGVGGVSIAGAAVHGPRAARAPSLATTHRLAVPGAQLWVKRYHGPGGRSDIAASVAASSDGRRVFVTGTSTGKSSGTDYATVAYSTVTGARLWVSRYNGPGNGPDGASAVVVSPDGSKVFVTGTSRGKTSGDDYATIAYNAVTGARLWVSRYNGPGNGLDFAGSSGDLTGGLAVSPDGRTVFVTGQSQGKTSGADYATVAYRAATGAQLWVRRYNGPGNGKDAALSLAVSPGGRTVFVTGRSQGKTSGSDYATVAYRAATGARLWVMRYNGPGNGDDFAFSVAVSPSGGAVFVTGASARPLRPAWATIAYSAATGEQLWVKRYQSPGSAGFDFAFSVAVSPSGRTVFVTGSSTGKTSHEDYATIAYNTATGAQLWVKRYNGPGNGDDFASSVVVSSDGRTVFVTGQSQGKTSGADYATIAYNAATGAQLRVMRYNGPGNRFDSALSVVVSPDEGRVFVTGASTGKTSGLDYATIAYQG